MAELVLYANPYEYGASGFYFRSAEEYEKAFDKHRPVEEYSLEFINGSSEDVDLFKVLEVDASNLEQFFTFSEDMDDSQKAALYYMIAHRGKGPGETVDDLIEASEDVSVHPGDVGDWAESFIEDQGGVGEFSREFIEQHFDYAAYGKIIKEDMEEGDYREDMSDEDAGYEFVNDIGIKNIPKADLEYHFDVDSWVTDLAAGGDVTAFEFGGAQYATDYSG